MNIKKDERPKGYRDTYDPNLTYKGETFDCVVIDGSNCIVSGGGDNVEYTFDRLLRTLNAVHALGWPTYVGIQKAHYNYIVHHSDLSEEGKKSLVEVKKLTNASLIDSKEDDQWLLRQAVNQNGWLLTHDRMKTEKGKYIKENPGIVNEINRRLCVLNFVGDEPVFNLPKRDTDTIISTKMAMVEDEIKEMINRLTSILVTLKVHDQTVDTEFKLGIPIGRKEFEALMSHEELGKVSGAHFRLDVKDGAVLFTDLSSTNGSMMNKVLFAPNAKNILEKNEENVIFIGSRNISIKISY